MMNSLKSTVSTSLHWPPPPLDSKSAQWPSMPGLLWQLVTTPTACSPSPNTRSWRQRRREWWGQQHGADTFKDLLMILSGIIYRWGCEYGVICHFLSLLQVNVTVSRSLGSLGSVWVTYQTSAHTAVSGEDFASASGRLLFTSGQTSQQVTLHIQDDNLPEGPEMFFLNITEVELVNIRYSNLLWWNWLKTLLFESWILASTGGECYCLKRLLQMALESSMELISCTITAVVLCQISHITHFFDLVRHVFWSRIY